MQRTASHKTAVSKKDARFQPKQITPEMIETNTKAILAPFKTMNWLITDVKTKSNDISSYNHIVIIDKWNNDCTFIKLTITLNSYKKASIELKLLMNDNFWRDIENMYNEGAFDEILKPLVKNQDDYRFDTENFSDRNEKEHTNLIIEFLKNQPTAKQVYDLGITIVNSVNKVYNRADCSQFRIGNVGTQFVSASDDKPIFKKEDFPVLVEVPEKPVAAIAPVVVIPPPQKEQKAITAITVPTEVKKEESKKEEPKQDVVVDEMPIEKKTVETRESEKITVIPTYETKIVIDHTPITEEMVTRQLEIVSKLEARLIKEKQTLHAMYDVLNFQKQAQQAYQFVQSNIKWGETAAEDFE